MALRTADRRYRRMREELKRSPDGAVCHVCKEWIDQTIPWPHPLAWTADHIVPVSISGDNYGELAAAHNKCNAGRQDGTGKRAKPTVHARRW